MKAKSRTQVTAGIFVALGVLLTLYFVFLLGDVDTFWVGRYQLKAEFEETAGLKKGSPITLAGIKVGQVEGIAFKKINSMTKIEVLLGVEEKYKNYIRQDSKARIVTQGLLGDKAVFVTVGVEPNKILQDGDKIKTEESFSLGTFTKGGTRLIDNVNELSENINGIVKDIKSGQGLMGSLIYDEEGKKVLKRLTNITISTSRILRQVERGDGLLHALVYDDGKGTLGRELNKTLKNMRLISEDFKKISARIEEGEGSVGGLINDPTVYYDLMTLLGGANRSKLLRSIIRATMAKNEKDTIGKKPYLGRGSQQ